MIPGEIITAAGEIELNKGSPTLTLKVANSGDRPIQVGSHYHFHEANEALIFDREGARGMRLDIAAGTAVRFEPGPGARRDAGALSGGNAKSTASARRSWEAYEPVPGRDAGCEPNAAGRHQPGRFAAA